MSKKSSKTNKKSFLSCVNELSRPSLIMLFSGLPLTLTAMLSMLSMMLTELRRSPSLVALTYPQILEYIMMSLLITVVGATALDILDKRG